MSNIQWTNETWNPLVRDLVIVDYGGSDRREAIIIDFLAHHIYLKFLDSGRTDFAIASQVSKIEVSQ